MVKNYQILKEQINHAIQNSSLDIGAAFFILKDIFRDVENMYYAQINKEYMDDSKGEDNDDTIK